MDLLKKHKWKSLLVGLLTLATVAYAAGYERIPKDLLLLGTGTSASKTIEFDVGLGSANPKVRGNLASPTLEFSSDGTSFLPLGSGSGGSSGVNVLANGDFELGVATGWTSSGGTFVAETGANLLNGTKSAAWDPSASSQTLTSNAATLPLVVDNKGCLASFFYRGGDTNYRVEIVEGASTVIATKNLDTSTAAKLVVLPFLCPTGATAKLRLITTADGAIIYLDDMFLGTRDRVRRSLELAGVNNVNATISGGGVSLPDGRVLKTYDGAGALSSDYGEKLTINLTTILGGSPANATKYSLCIDKDTLGAAVVPTDTLEKVVGLVQANFALLTTAPSDTFLPRYLCLAFITTATTGNFWSGQGSSFDDYPRPTSNFFVDNGELNLVESPSTVIGWTTTGANGPTAVTTTTVGDIPLAGTIDTAIKMSSATVAGAEAAHYFSYPLATGEALKNRKLKVDLWMRPGANFLSNEWTVSVYSGATRMALSTDSAGFTFLPSATGKFTTTFDTDSSASYTLRFSRPVNAGLNVAVLNVAGIIAGPGVQPQGAVVGDWASYSTTIFGGQTGGTKTGRWRRVGSSMELEATVDSPSAWGVYQDVTLPSGYTIDTSTLTVLKTAVGTALTRVNNSSAWYAGSVFVGSTTTVRPGGSGIQVDMWAASISNPAAYTANQGSTSIHVTIPISEWAGSGTVNLAQNDVEYASNSSTSTTASDTTSFAVGPQGSQIQNITATLERTVQFPSAFQVTDAMNFEVSADRQVWLPLVGELNFPGVGNIESKSVQSANAYGIGISRGLTNTQVIVRFSQYSSVSGGAYGAAGQPWGATLGGYFWRVVKAKSGQAVGFGAATATSSGLVSKEISGSFTAALTGCTTVPTVTAKHSVIGKTVTVTIPANSATSNTTAATITGMPASIYPLNQVSFYGRSINSSVSAVVNFEISTSGVITFYSTVASAAFANTGLKGHGELSFSYTIN